jgi:transposase
LKGILFVGLKTLEKWIKTYLAQGLEGLRQWGYQGQASDLSAAQWAELEAELERRPYRTAKEVVAFVKKKFDLSYSERGMQNLLRHKGYRRIKTRLMPGPDDENKQREQADFIERYFNLKAQLGPHDRIYHLDAVHPTHTVQISYVWTKKGCRRRLRSNSARKRYNILGAYCPLDQEYLDIRATTNVNGETLQKLIDKIRAHHPQAQRIILILDNARYNHAKIVRAHIAHTNVELVHLPAYSPNLNLIERLWRFFKDKVMTTYHESFEKFVQEIDKVLDNLADYADELTTLMTEKFEILACA